MRCPYCKANNDRVVDSRTSGEADVIRRRRECLECGGRFTTYEKAGEATLRVVKKDGSRVPFDRDKLLEGLLVACHKRPIETSTLESIVTDIESQLHEMFDKEVASKFIGHQVMEALRGLDQVAYVRFASVYREFKDVNQFLDELKPLLGSSDSDRGGSRPKDGGPEVGGPAGLGGGAGAGAGDRPGHGPGPSPGPNPGIDAPLTDRPLGGLSELDPGSRRPRPDDGFKSTRDPKQNPAQNRVQDPVQYPVQDPVQYRVDGLRAARSSDGGLRAQPGGLPPRTPRIDGGLRAPER